MNVLFVHQNFPGQFKNLVPAMARQGLRVMALNINACNNMPSVELVRYAVASRPGQGTHRWLTDLEVKTLRGTGTGVFGRTLRSGDAVFASTNQLVLLDLMIAKQHRCQRLNV